jgi:hypothetical protein
VGSKMQKTQQKVFKLLEEMHHLWITCYLLGLWIWKWSNILNGPPSCGNFEPHLPFHLLYLQRDLLDQLLTFKKYVPVFSDTIDTVKICFLWNQDLTSISLGLILKVMSIVQGYLCLAKQLGMKLLWKIGKFQESLGNKSQRCVITVNHSRAGVSPYASWQCTYNAVRCMVYLTNPSCDLGSL